MEECQAKYANDFIHSLQVMSWARTVNPVQFEKDERQPSRLRKCLNIDTKPVMNIFVTSTVDYIDRLFLPRTHLIIIL